MAKFIDTDGLLYFWQKIKNQFADKSDIPSPSSTSPKMNGTAAVGTETTWAHGDHVHPTDTSRAPIASPTFTGTPAAPTAAAGTNTTQIATTAFVKGAIDALDTGVTSVAGKTGAVTLEKADITDLAAVTTTANDTGLMTAADKTKLNNIAAGAEVNQNAFSNVKVGTTTIAADGKTDTVEFVAGDNVTLTPDATNDKVTITTTDTTYESKAAASGGTDVSLVTTGEKYTWNNKTSNTGTVTSVATGAGLTGGSITTTGTVKANLVSETKLTNAAAAATETAGRVYPVALDKDGKMAVNVPWTDNNTTALGDMSGTLGVGHGGTGVATLGAGVVYHSASGTGAMSIATAANLVSALGTTAVNRATADASGNNIADTYAKKTDIASMYKYKGSVATASALPESPTTGDVYNIEAASAYGAAGANVAWNGTAWDSLGEIFTIQAITNAEIDTIVAS